MNFSIKLNIEKRKYFDQTSKNKRPAYLTKRSNILQWERALPLVALSGYKTLNKLKFQAQTIKPLKYHQIKYFFSESANKL